MSHVVFPNTLLTSLTLLFHPRKHHVPEKFFAYLYAFNLELPSPSRRLKSLLTILTRSSLLAVFGLRSDPTKGQPVRHLTANKMNLPRRQTASRFSASQQGKAILHWRNATLRPARGYTLCLPVLSRRHGLASLPSRLSLAMRAAETRNSDTAPCRDPGIQSSLLAEATKAAAVETGVAAILRS